MIGGYCIKATRVPTYSAHESFSFVAFLHQSSGKLISRCKQRLRRSANDANSTFNIVADGTTHFRKWKSIDDVFLVLFLKFS